MKRRRQSDKRHETSTAMLESGSNSQLQYRGHSTKKYLTAECQDWPNTKLSIQECHVIQFNVFANTKYFTK